MNQFATPPKKRSKPWIPLLKLIFVVGLLYFLAKKGFISLKDTSRAFTQWRDTLPAMAILASGTLLGVVRWQLLLRSQGIHMTWLRTLQLNMIGNFFNVALPGAVSGDFVKAFYIGKEIQGKRARAFGSILFDRVAGLSALVLVSATSFAFGVESFPAVRFFVITAASVVIFFYAYLFLVREHHDPLLRTMRRIENRFPKAGSFTRVYEGLRHYHNHRTTVVYVLAISVVVHLLVAFACLQFAQALGDNHLPYLSACVVVPLGLLVTAVPIFPAGVGTGHAAFFYLFKLIGSQKGADVFTLFALVNITVGAIGGLFYLQFRGDEPAPNFNQVESTPTV